MNPPDRNSSLAPDPLQVLGTGSHLIEDPRFFERLTALSPDPMYVVDVAEHRFLYVNEATVRLIGVPTSRLMVPNGSFLLLERVHPDDMEKTRLHYRTLYRPLPPDATPESEPTVEGLEYRLRDSRGNWRWFYARESVFARTPEGHVTQIIGIAHDITNFKHAEAKLRENETDLREAQRLAHVGSWYWDNRSTDAPYRHSEEILRIFGLEPGSKVPGFQDQKGTLYPHDSWEKVQDAIGLTWTTGVDAELEVQGRKPDGSLIWLISRAEAVRNHSGEIIGLRGTVQDITERKRTESAIRTSEIQLAESRHAEELLLASRKRQQAIFDSLFGFIGLFTLDGEFVEINREPLLVGGLKRDAVIGRKLADVIWFPDVRRARRLLKEAFKRAAAGHVVRFETPVLLQDASTIVVDTMFGPLLDESGEVVNIIGFAVDITARKQAERDLRDSRLWLELALQSAQMGSWRLDLKSGIYTGDRISKIMHGVEDIQTFDKFEDGSPYIHPDDLPELRARFDQALLEGGHYSSEYRVLLPGGKTTWVQAIGRVDRERDCLIAIVQDITLRKQAEEQNATLRDELAHVARLGTLGEMATGLAHELNQPLAALQLYAGSALQLLSPADPAPLTSLLQKISDQSLRAGEIIRRMRNFIGRGNQRLTAANLDRLIHDVLQMLESNLRHNRIHLDYRSAPRLPLVDLDVIQIQQILVNLIRNAVESMSSAERRILTITTSRESSNVRISVADSGAGIDPQVAPHLFEPFQTTREQGLGLGLAISRTLVESHGGTISAAPNPDGGAVFSFTLPITRPQENP